MTNENRYSSPRLNGRSASGGVHGSIAECGPPIFVLSFVRAGSTLLRYLLDGHPEICCPGELRLGSLCELWFAAIEATLGQVAGADVDTQRSLQVLHTRCVIDDLLQNYCVTKGKHRWCDKSPNNLNNLGFIAAVFPDAQYLCLHRHGLDVARSAIEVGMASSMSPDDNLAAACIEQWCVATERLLAFERALSPMTTRVTYEDLVTNPEQELDRIFDFLGVAHCPEVLSSAFSARHDDGAGDPKIAGTAGIDGSRIGHGLTLDIRSVPESLRLRMLDLMSHLGYA